MFNWLYRQRERFALTGAWLPAMGVAVATGYASWGHIEHVGLMVGEPKAYLLPVAVDGMMLAGAFFALVDRLRGFEPRGWSIVCLWFGSMLTVSFNMLSALGRGWAAMAVSAVFAITFLFTVEAAFHPSRVMFGETARATRRTARRMIKLAAARSQYAASLVNVTSQDAAPVPETVPVATPAPVAPTPVVDVPEPMPEPASEPVSEAAPASDLPSWLGDMPYPAPSTGHQRRRVRRPVRAAIEAASSSVTADETGDLIEVTADAPRSGLAPVAVTFSGNGGSMDES